MTDEGVRFVLQKTNEIFQEMRKVIVGQEEAMRGLLIALFCQGHALLEGVPGTAKTLMVRALARIVQLRFTRIQFTPDLMPSDVVGTNVFDLQKNEFVLRRGPIFTDLLLADEINRTPAKTQAALLEAMQERRVTIDGVPYPLGSAFTVYATQNPIEYEGTYPLPEAQLDRFLLKIQVGYPSEWEEDRILDFYNRGLEPHRVDTSNVEPRLTAEDIAQCREVIRNLRMDDTLVSYVRQLMVATRQSDEILVGCGPRAGIHLLLASKAHAALNGREFVTPDDIQTMAFPTLRHRLILNPEAQAEGLTTDEVIRSVLDKVPVPR
jgi:MoxR-like ATPase